MASYRLEYLNSLDVSLKPELDASLPGNKKYHEDLEAVLAQVVLAPLKRQWYNQSKNPVTYIRTKLPRKPSQGYVIQLCQDIAWISCIETGIELTINSSEDARRAYGLVKNI